MQQVINALTDAGVEEVKRNEPLSRHTTWKVGGPADLLVVPKNRWELESVMKVISSYQLPWRVIGRGSNLLVRDGGIRGVVIKLGGEFSGFEVNDTTVTVGGGHSTLLLANKTAKKGLTGLEFAGGIPGNVGGAVYMNAGAHGSDISKVLLTAEVLTASGEWLTLSNEELQFRYRTSILQKELPGIVVQATFQLEEGDAEKITAFLTSFKDRRRKTQPLQFPCAGSVFRNPPGDHAGRLIQASGLKGYQVGQAQISELHGNFIINLGEAKAKDVLSLIEEARKVVYERYQIQLETEVQIIGEDE